MIAITFINHFLINSPTRNCYYLTNTSIHTNQRPELSQRPPNGRSDGAPIRVKGRGRVVLNCIYLSNIYMVAPLLQFFFTHTVHSCSPPHLPGHPMEVKMEKDKGKEKMEQGEGLKGLQVGF